MMINGMMINRILVANRGEITRRVFRTARRLGIQTVAVHSEVDAQAPFVREADISVELPGNTSAQTYLNVDLIIDAARRSGADAIHPGYGFLSENPAFAEAVVAAGFTWIGPPPAAIRSMALKVQAKKLAAQARIPLVPGAELAISATDSEIIATCDQVGYPLLVKASAGGGGKGMRSVKSASEVVEAVSAARREAQSAFGDPTVFLERYLSGSRHIEVQVFGDAHGNIVHLFERECSIQRRHQKIVEEAPAPALHTETAEAMYSAATSLTRSIDYVGAGTVEFLVTEDAAGQEFYFLEMNTRLQVEHPVTEALTGLDLVEWQIRIARGEELPLHQNDIHRYGHTIEVRLYAEDPARGYLPNTGTLEVFRIDPAVRTDSGVESGSEISAYYDPMLAKVIAHESDRVTAAAVLADALRRSSIAGLTTNRESLISILTCADFIAGDTPTNFLDLHPELLTSGLDATSLDRHLVAAAISRTPVGDVPTGWRNVPALGEIHTFATPDRQAKYIVSLTWCRDGVTAKVDDGDAHKYTVIELDASLSTSPTSSLSLTCKGVTHHLHIDNVGGWVSIVDGTAATQWWVMPRYNDDSGGDASATGPSTPVPGTITMVEVAPGDHVVAGQCLVVLEAMKMEHRVVAEADAVVAEVLVTVGEAVDAHTVVVHLVEPSGNESAE